MINCELCKKFEFEHMNKWYMLDPEYILKKWDAQTSLGFWDTNGSSISARRQDVVIVNKKKKKKERKRKKRTCRIGDFAVQADNRVKLKESEKRDKYLDLAREQKNYGIWKWRWYQ